MILGHSKQDVWKRPGAAGETLEYELTGMPQAPAGLGWCVCGVGGGGGEEWHSRDSVGVGRNRLQLAGLGRCKHVCGVDAREEAAPNALQGGTVLDGARTPASRWACAGRRGAGKQVAQAGCARVPWAPALGRPQTLKSNLYQR